MVGQYIITLLPYSCDIQRRKKYHGNGVLTVSMSEANHIINQMKIKTDVRGLKRDTKIQTITIIMSQSLLNLNTIQNVE